MSAGGAGADIDWSELEGAYGPATEVPEILAGLSDPELVADAVDDLFSSVIHQGSLYPVSGPAVVEVARLLAAGRCADPVACAVFVDHYGQCVERHRAHLEGLRADARGHRRAADRVGGHQARLDEAADVLAPLLRDVGSLDPLSARLLVLLQGRRSRLDAQRIAVLERLAADAAEAGAPDADTAGATAARAAAFALGRHGLDGPGTAAARACLLLGRVAAGRATADDARALAAAWPVALRVADVCVNEVTENTGLPMWLVDTDPRSAVMVLAALPADAAGADEDVVEALAAAAVTSRGATPSVLARLLELAESPGARTDAMVRALRQMPPRPGVRDALVRLASRPDALRPGSSRIVPRAAAARALAAQGDRRWAGLLASMMRAHPRSSDPRGIGWPLTGFTFTSAAPTPELLDAVAGLLTDPAAADGVVRAALSLVYDWNERHPADVLAPLAPALERVCADRPSATTAVSVLASWGDERALARLRERAAAGDESSRIALAHATGAVEDYEAARDHLPADGTRDLMLTRPATDDSGVLARMEEVRGDRVARSWPEQRDQLTAARRLVDAGRPAAEQLPIVFGLLEKAGAEQADTTAGEAAALAADWDRAGLLRPGDSARLRSLLTGISLRDPAEAPAWVGPGPFASAAAVLVRLTGRWPGAPARAGALIAACMTDLRTNNVEAGLALAEALSAAAIDAPVGRAVAAVLEQLLDSDKRFDVGREADMSDRAGEDERICRRLCELLTGLRRGGPADGPGRAADIPR